jgi:hypothetical protein
MNHETMMELTKAMPCKVIEVNGKPYLERYFAGTTSDDYDVFVHHFLSADGDEHLHSHPRDSYSLPVVGGYLEETNGGAYWRYPPEFNSDQIAFVQKAIAGPMSNFQSRWIRDRSRRITVFDWHRIAAVKPDTWSLFIVGPDILPYWYFNDNGEVEPVKSSPRDWWKGYGPRGEQ